jgi:hypothetical protein
VSAKQITFFEKNKADFTDTLVSATASEASSYAYRVLDRSNLTAWVTTDSLDANNTTLTVDLVNQHQLTDILLVEHNFKAFTVKYWDGAAYQDFSTPIAETNCTDTTSRYSFTEITTTKLQVTITGTQVANDDKSLCQFIATKLIGTLNGWPLINNPVLSKNLQKTQMLSGKTNMIRNVGAFSCQLDVKNWRDSTDLTTVETLYDSVEGFLVWLGGGNESQFSSVRQGYRKKDIFLMSCVNEHVSQWADGLYKSGMVVSIQLAEVNY